MTSFAFILGVLSIVLATRADANARRVDRHHRVHGPARVDLPYGSRRHSWWWCE
jgi:hypothetical protein